jgi:hypothetical protein
VAVKPIRAGTRIQFVGETLTQTLPSLASTVAVAGTSDWGPTYAETASILPGLPGGDQTYGSTLEFDAIYGNSDTPLRRAVIGALNGQGVENGGAGQVLVKRLASSSAARATKTVANTTPVTAMTLTAKWTGTRGNLISYTIGNDPRVATNDIFTVYVNGVAQEVFTYVDADVAGLAAQINLSSKLLTAVSNITGTALAVQASQAFLTGGLSGDTLTGVDYTNVYPALEYGRYSVLAFDNLTDSTIIASAVAFSQTQESNGRPITLVIGGSGADTITTAVARSAAANDPHVVNIGIGIYYDELLQRNVSTAELAPRIAGVIAARGEERSLTFAKVAGLSPVSGAPDSGQIETAIVNGVVTLSRSTSADALLKVERGVTTFTSKSDAARPYDVFSDPRLVRVMDLFIRTVKEWSDENIVGDTTVTDDTRDAVRSFASGEIDRLIQRGLVLPEDKSLNIPAPFVSTPKTTDDTVPFDFGWQFARTTNYVFGFGRIR